MPTHRPDTSPPRAPVDARLLDAVRADLEELASRQRRTPSPTQVHALLRQHGLDPRRLDALLDAPHGVAALARRNRHVERDERQDVRDGERLGSGGARTRGPAPAGTDRGAAPRRTAAAATTGPTPASTFAAASSTVAGPAPDADAATARPAAEEDRAGGTGDSSTGYPGVQSEHWGDGFLDDWNDADPFAVPVDRTPVHVDISTGNPTTDPGGHPRVARVLADLRADHARAGRVDMLDVTSAARAAGLDADQLERLLLDLATCGIAVAPAEQPRGYDGSRDLDGGEVRRRAGSADRDQLGAYMTAAGRYKLLSHEEVVRLGRAIQAGRQAVEGAEHCAGRAVHPGASAVIAAGRRAHEVLVCANLRLVVSIARLPRYSASGLDLAERIQLGNIGLMRAADKFDPELGYRFSTYATWWIRQSVDRGVADLGRSIRLPVHLMDKVNRVRGAQRRLSWQLGRDPSLADLATAADLDAGEVAAILTWSAPVASLDAAVGDEGDTTVLDLLRIGQPTDVLSDPALVAEAAHLASSLRRLLDEVLDPRQARVVRERYGLDDGEPATLEEVGTRMGVTRERVRQLQVKAFERLRTAPGTAQLYQYLVDVADERILFP